MHSVVFLPLKVCDGSRAALKDAKMIRIDAVWLVIERMDMLAGADTAPAGKSLRRSAPATGLFICWPKIALSNEV